MQREGVCTKQHGDAAGTRYDGLNVTSRAPAWDGRGEQKHAGDIPVSSYKSKVIKVIKVSRLMCKK